VIEDIHTIILYNKIKMCILKNNDLMKNVISKIFN